MKKYVEKIFKHREDFMIIGLTGKTGSGCSTIANILSQGYVEYSACDHDATDLENKKNIIIQKFVSKKFAEKKFQIIKPSTLLMMLFIFEKKIIMDLIKNVLADDAINLKKLNTLKEIYTIFISFKDENNFLPDLISYIDDIEQNPSDDIIKNNFKTYILEKKEEYQKKLLEENIEHIITEINSIFETDITSLILIDEKIVAENEYICVSNSDHFQQKFKKKREIFEKTLHYLAKHKSQNFIDTYKKFNKIISEKRTSNILTIPILQEIGDLVRNEMDIFQLPLYIQLLIKAFAITMRKDDKPCYVVIDSLKNPFEIFYFKERYSAFYTFSIHARDEIIYERYSHLSPVIDIKAIHKREILKEGTEKAKGSLESKKDFNSQNIIECIQRSDIYIDNNKDKTDTLYRQVFKYLSLIIHPGLITPSHDEVIMQLALNAKLNSGCISRQVGAVVLNKHGSIKAIGWNDVPEGQTPCLLRSHHELLNNSQSTTYSKYEQETVRTSDKFKYIFSDKKSDIHQYDSSTAIGLNDAFCFKGIQNKIDNDKNQVYTRSLHAEENAFLQASKYGNSEIIGGQLFTTSSPCFLCAKKAYQLGMERIVYIEAYPDISDKQVLNIGTLTILMVHFRGAIGIAYHKLYEPIFSYKDELKALNS